MARTNRNIQWANLNAREVRHYNYRRNEMASLEELVENGFVPSNRHRSAQNRIADNYDDYKVSAYDEVWNDD